MVSESRRTVSSVISRSVNMASFAACDSASSSASVLDVVTVACFDAIEYSRACREASTDLSQLFTTISLIPTCRFLRRERSFQFGKSGLFTERGFRA